MWFIWNKTTFGKNLYAVGGNPEAAAVSGISVFAVTVGAFVLAGILYGFGDWLECMRIFTALTYSLTILGIDTNLQFVFSGIIILTAVTLDCLKYVQKK